MVICAVNGCERHREKREWCGMHYQRWWKHGSADYEPDYVCYAECVVGGCTGLPRSARSPYCEKHYYRLRRTGSLSTQTRISRHWKTDHGYVACYAPEHPLATAQGSVYVHRKVLYDALGDKTQPCYWCGQVVDWERLHVDHVNGDREDNRVENLVPSCPSCNSARGIVRGVAKRLTVEQLAGLLSAAMSQPQDQ